MVKLRNLGVADRVLNWVTDLLKIEDKESGSESSWTPVKIGVPHGSVIGPLLFVCYINDLHDGLISDVFVYADDSKISREISCQGDCERCLSGGLRNGSFVSTLANVLCSTSVGGTRAMCTTLGPTGMGRS